jgi:pseudaminic acid cytidylyltransferase
MNLAVIPARGGSKRIPRKNIKAFAGKPMIAHSIHAALESGLFERVVVSTDDAEIAAIAQKWGAEVPFLRPAELADDHTPTAPVVKHAIDQCNTAKSPAAFVCCIYPCAPFVQAGDLRSALALLKQSDADYCIPLAEFPSPVQRALLRNPDGHVRPMYPEYQFTRTQDLKRAFFDAGQFYWGNMTAWNNNPQIHSNAIGIHIPHWRVVDIDTPDDWTKAELIYKAMIGNAS